MRVTISHNRPQAEVIKSVDRGIDEVFKGLAIGPIEVADTQKSWDGTTMTFSFTAKMGFMKAPIRGTAVVTDKDVTIDADLGLLENLITPRTKAELESRVKGLLT